MADQEHLTGAAAQVRNVSTFYVRTVPSVMQHFGCTAEAAQRYIDLRDDGHGVYVAAVLAGIADPKS